MQQYLTENIIQNLGHPPTQDQLNAITKLAVFCSPGNQQQVFILKGYAGTGKTSLISALVKSLPTVKLKSALLAPTGRAAKVLSSYSDKPALTIHKRIYKRAVDDFGNTSFILQANFHTHTIFIVDEASMISASGSLMNNSNLLRDLMDYVFSGITCKLIFIGDTAQLPPVGLSVSPALDESHFEEFFRIRPAGIELREVVRQTLDSGIYFNATKIRDLIRNQVNQQPQFLTDAFPDIRHITGADLEDEVNSAYGKYGEDETIVICRSNKRANLFNQQIRHRIRFTENEINAGDYMMVVKNNYMWLKEESKAGFIANGEIIELQKITKVYERYGFKFADVRMRMVDHDDPPMDVKLLLDTIMIEAPALSQAQNMHLYKSVVADHEGIEDKKKKQLSIKNDPHLNALQVKFAYAVTCHKAQGGQWDVVFIDQGYLTDQMINEEYMRWLYTAITRAKKKLFLLNFKGAGVQ